MGGFTLSRIETRDSDLMADMMSSALGAVDMSVIDPRDAYLSIRSAVSPSLSALDFQLSFRGTSDLDGLERDPADHVYSVVYMDREPGSGRLWDAQGRQLDILHPVLYPDWVGSEFDGCHAKVVSIARSEVRDYARRLAGTDAFDLRFTDVHPRSATLGEHWYATRRYMMSAIELSADDPGVELIQGQLPGLIAATVLATFPTTLTDHLDRHDARPLGATAAIRRAVAYIDEHAQEPITLADIVSASRLGVRALHAGFRRHLDTTPMGYLHKVRLNAARLDLLAGDPTRETVAAIARRWGFTHLGRFASNYRAAFDELPSQSLRR
ncbi:helix-turn-helix transcriptional regulator [Herbiconiux sp. KACC 21604]|uniref:helix-turn-helix transcriptional regulator n=1 Tax=unclassified Herbiconiux TaxID=2618217 RepID=UPI001491412D|nr:helix-turn-helix transcriptional regulator [Herbiconiux sp. SALV-R1]QJU55750.1 helix-turn-helix transcriptional regulator [Herbiconiux sp. SALV-R1]WPO86958.1 helix-turn-helix transcriptional regulator [Herbiconiux sp. KACC 21604]